MNNNLKIITNHFISKKMKMKNKAKSQTGSITTIVTVTIIFFVTVLSNAYVIAALQRKVQLKKQLSTREMYQQEINNANEIYNSIVDAMKPKVITAEMVEFIPIDTTWKTKNGEDITNVKQALDSLFDN